LDFGENMHEPIVTQKTWDTVQKLMQSKRRETVAKKASQKYMDGLISLKTEKQKKEVGKYRRELTSIEKRLSELNKILNKLYEDNALDKISHERYTTMFKGYENEQVELQERNKISPL